MSIGPIDIAEDCIFCAIGSGSAPATRVAEDDLTLTFMDIHPATPGHMLVIPKRHSDDLLGTAPDDLAAMALSAQRAVGAAKTALGADGVNLLNCTGPVAWQSVFHVHLHVIPRYRDRGKDRLVLPWQPNVPGHPETLAALGSRLRDGLS
ncbi:HIT domain-containing protein [Jongsikchunia kroppenstedtii]|uniref:HIT family protein n=1 Tax=Jongsikchunia kroppenstedtii TaxID=1121721 RepID=UPI00035FAB57